ncbi:MAG TPA: hypothetical protein VF777_12115 [Phycisphaerales bacterium]
MSILSREHETIATPPGAAEHTIGWNVSARALAGVCPDVLAANPATNSGVNVDREDATLEILVEIDGERFHGAVLVRHAGRCAALDDVQGVVERSLVGEAALVHLDSRDLVATLRVRDVGFETMYARLPLLSRLGLAGGRYELRPSCDHGAQKKTGASAPVVSHSRG